MKSPLNCSAGDALRSLVSVDDTIMYFPSGVHSITPSQNKKAVDVLVEVNAQTAREMQEQLEALNDSGKRPYFSFGDDSHASDQASFWPSKFFWATRQDATGKMATGVWVTGEWSDEGKRVVEGKVFRCFSPTFFVDAVRNDPKRPAQIICERDAGPNMGALVNDPAFEKISPLWAKNAANNLPSRDGEQRRSSGNNQQETNMQVNETIAELEARITTLESEIAASSAKTDPSSKTELRAKRAELKEAEATLKLAKAQDEFDKGKALLVARREQDADAEIARLENIGYVQPRETEKKTELRAKFVNDPSLIGMFGAGPKVAALEAGRKAQGANVPASTGPVRIGADMRGALRSMAITAKQSANKDQDLKTKFDASREIGRIYKAEIAPLLAKGEYFPLNAADYSGGDGLADNTLGILSGTLVAQRTLDLYKFEFPVLGSITTDFSDQPAQFGQTTVTRIIVVPAVLTYNNTADATGRPVGYTIVTPAQTIDAPITLNKHRAVDVVFDANTLASTTRNLFAEQAEANAYALGLDVVNALYANITPANFGNNAGDNAPFSVPVINYGRPTFSKAKRVFNLQGVPFTNRFALSSSYMQEQLEQDPTLVSLAVFQKPEIITDAQLPMINRFLPYEAPNLPATAVPGVGNGTLAAFFAHKTALLMQSRIPNDWSTVLGTNSGYGQVSVVTNPDTGLSVLLVQFSNPQSAHAEYRLALIYGTAKGNSKGGQIVTN